MDSKIYTGGYSCRRWYLGKVVDLYEKKKKKKIKKMKNIRQFIFQKNDIENLIGTCVFD